MFVRTKKKDENRWHVQIVESIRQGDSVQQKLIRSIGVAHSPEEVEQFKKIGEKAIIHIKNSLQPVLAFVDPELVHAPKQKRKLVDDKVKLKDLKEDRRVIEGIQDIFGTVFEQMVKAYPQLAYKADESKRDEHDFWSVGVYQFKDGTSRYLSEDWFFCQRWLDLGGKIYGDTKVVVKHVGQAVYPLKTQEAELMF